MQLLDIIYLLYWETCHYFALQEFMPVNIP